VIEQAKGILMARQAVDGDRAFELLRDRSQRTGRKLADVAAAVIESHLLLPPVAPASADSQLTAAAGAESPEPDV
jgi:hypothetical protein